MFLEKAQIEFTYSKLTIEGLEKSVIYVHERHCCRSGAFIANFEHMFTLCTSDSIVNFALPCNCRL